MCPFVGNPSVPWEHLSLVLLLSGFVIGCKSLSFPLQISDFCLENEAGEREKVSF